MAPKTFAPNVDDLVLAYHCGMLYDAKIRKIDDGTGVKSSKALKKQKSTASAKDAPTASTVSYYLHYQKWNAKWDEWVTIDRLEPVNAETRKLQQELKSKILAQETERKKKKGKRIHPGGAAKSNKSIKQSPFQKLKRDTEMATEEHDLPTEEERGSGEKRMALQMPFVLKKHLVEDWRRLSHEPVKLVPLPRKPNVDQIIKAYLESKADKVKSDDKKDEREYQNVKNIMEGVQEYFDKALGALLLYRMERPQYDSLCEDHPDTPMSQLYGAEHLLRLFVRLPLLVNSAPMLEREREPVASRLQDFIKFLQRNSSNYLLQEYDDVSPEYTAKALQAVSN